MTAAAILEFLREFKGITGDKPVSSAELEFAKASITRGFPAGFETPRNIAMQLLNLVEFRLPDDYFDKFVPAVSAVTAPAVMRAAQELIDIEHLSIVVIGDRLRIQGPLQETFPEHKLVISQFDDEFRLVPAH